MRFARTQDPALIRAIVCHPKVWRWSAEDGVSAEDWSPVFGEGVVYVAAMEGRTLVALFVFERKTSTRWAVHLAIAPSQWARGEAAFKGAIQWAWENLSVRRIAGEIPADNKHALRLAKRAGFELVGTDKQAFLRGGVLQDVHIVGLSRPQQVQEVAA